MARPRLAALASLVLAAALSGGGWSGQPAAPARHVVLVSIDGFAAFHLRNPALDLPNIRALAAAGTAAESSETVFPSVTHPSHTTLVTGVPPRLHGVVNNNVRDRRSGARFHITNLPRRESVNVPTIFDAVKARGLRTAAFYWPETKDDPAIDDNVAEVFAADGGPDPSAVTPGLLDELRAAGVPIDGFYAFYDNPFTHVAGDVALTRAAAHVLAARRPALVAIHLLFTDDVQHDVGPAHPRAAAALAAADYCVGLLRQAVADAGLAESTTFVIAADHGFATVTDELNVAPLLREPALDGAIRWHEDRWYLWAERLAGFDEARHQPAFDRVLERLSRRPGIARIVRPGGFGSLGYPEYDDNVYVPGHYLVAADIDTALVIDESDPEVRRRRRARPYHGHGYLPDHPAMYPALVWSGAGIASGRTIGHVRNVDVAPTVARLLGVELPTATGRVLDEVFQRR